MEQAVAKETAKKKAHLEQQHKLKQCQAHMGKNETLPHAVMAETTRHN